MGVEGSQMESMNDSYQPFERLLREAETGTISSSTVSLTTLRDVYILTCGALVDEYSRIDRLRSVLASLRLYINNAESSSSHQVLIEESTWLATVVEYRSSLNVHTHISEIVRLARDCMERDEQDKSGITFRP